MPRKRTTRLQPVAKPKGNNFPVAEGVSEKERKEQLEIFLRDFDSRVKNVLQDMENKKIAMRRFIEMRYEKFIADLPWEIRDMTLKDFAMCGGTIEAAMMQVQRTEQDARQKRLDEVQNCRWTEPLEDITEEDADAPLPELAQPVTSKPKRTARKTVSHTVKAQARTKSTFVTPASSMTHSGWAATPLYTPKFDVNLPGTPENTRPPKPGERMISMAGSPLQATSMPVGAINDDELVQDLSSIGIDLTPNRMEQMIRLVAQKIIS